MSFEVGQKVLVTIDGHEIEWEVAVVLFKGHVLDLKREMPNNTLAVLQINSKYGRPLPMEEPQQWGSKVTDDDGDWLLFVEGSEYRNGGTWVSRNGEHANRNWRELRSPRPYKGEQA